MQETIYWHDYETTGIDPVEDRPIQFAGIRTDLDFNQQGEPLVLYSQLSGDVVPSPEAMLVSGIKLSTLEQKGVIETEFIDQINHEFSTPGTCVCGYNSIRFDDEFTRQTLYRNLMDPYAREWQGGNSRWDVIDLLRTAHALRPEGMNWPTDEKGAPVFRLEDLARANGIAHESAHDALSDVRATIGLAALLRLKQPRLYEYLFRLRGKKQVLDQMYPLGKAPILHISGMYGAERGCLAMVLPLCAHPTNSNGIIVVDLTADPEPLISLPSAEINRLLFTRGEDLEEGERRMPLKTLHVNRAPAIAPVATLPDAAAGRFGLNEALCREHMAAIQHSAGLVEKVQEAWAMTSFPPISDPDFMLYGGEFFGPRDKRSMAEIRARQDGDFSRVNLSFDDARLEEMVFRYKARNYPSRLTSQEVERWREFLCVRWREGEVLDEFQTRIVELKLQNENSPAALEVLAELAAHGDKIRSEIVQRPAS